MVAQAAPRDIAVTATAALPASLACFARSRRSIPISSTTRSIAVFIHSAANTMMPPIIMIAVSAAHSGRYSAKEVEIQFAKIHCFRLGSVCQTLRHPSSDQTTRSQNLCHCCDKKPSLIPFAHRVKVCCTLLYADEHVQGKTMRTLVSKINWPILIVACATIGLAPLFPEPHVWEKLRMLVQGNLTRAIDWFDLVMHGTPWVLLVLKICGTFGRDAE